MTDKILVLIVEDDDGHATLIEEHLTDAGLCNPIQRFRDGKEAWDFLSAAVGTEGSGTPPWLLLLDIRMPRMDGVEVLRRVKAHPRLRKLPVVMLTTTDDPKEIDECYELGCNVYVTKPVDFSRFTETLKRLGLFLQIVRVPEP